MGKAARTRKQRIEDQLGHVWIMEAGDGPSHGAAKLRVEHEAVETGAWMLRTEVGPLGVVVTMAETGETRRQIYARHVVRVVELFRSNGQPVAAISDRQMAELRRDHKVSPVMAPAQKPAVAARVPKGPAISTRLRPAQALKSAERARPAEKP